MKVFKLVQILSFYASLVNDRDCCVFSNSKGALDLYCPNCGLKGHHIDHPFQDQRNNVHCCVVPKHDAFAKYPRCKLISLGLRLFVHHWLMLFL